jgi:hypothetical protein
MFFVPALRFLSGFDLAFKRPARVADQARRLAVVAEFGFTSKIFHYKLVYK